MRRATRVMTSLPGGVRGGVVGAWMATCLLATCLLAVAALASCGGDNGDFASSGGAKQAESPAMNQPMQGPTASEPAPPAGAAAGDDGDFGGDEGEADPNVVTSESTAVATGSEALADGFMEFEKAPPASQPAQPRKRRPRKKSRRLSGKKDADKVRTKALREVKEEMKKEAVLDLLVKRQDDSKNGQFQPRADAAPSRDHERSAGHRQGLEGLAKGKANANLDMRFAEVDEPEEPEKPVLEELEDDQIRSQDEEGRFDFRTTVSSRIHDKPDSFLPRMFYFENTYLGGDAAYAERLRRLETSLAESGRPWQLAHGYQQPFDAPTDAGMSLSASLDLDYVDQPSRVLLQVGLRGSDRYGWRRPPLDIVVVVDAPLLVGDAAAAKRFVSELVRRLGPQDRLGVVTAGARGVEIVAPVDRLRTWKGRMDRLLAGLNGSAIGSRVGAAMQRSGELLDAASEEAAVPGTQTVLLLTAGQDPERVAAAELAAHGLTTNGVVTSVIEVGADDRTAGAWWRVANAGHGNYHRAPVEQPEVAVEAELAALSKVVARLLRVNVRLAPGVKAVRVLGSRKLDDEEVAQVKAREKAIDVKLSKSLGVESDRGDDDDGVQTVIPYFYGGDTHVLLIELWVEKPGPVADVTLKYKDMVNLRNARSTLSVALPATPRELAPDTLAIRRNAAGFELAEQLQSAGFAVRHGRFGEALELVTGAPAVTARDRQLLGELQELVRQAQQGRVDRWTASEALVLAGLRKVGQPPPEEG